ncbi:MAG: aldo/keto reductase [Deltaproteobacteria bacterium]|nr:aldo/keto reductase [Deltaproteobacteria bacterium]
MDQRRLGKSDIEISALGLGCWQFSEGKGGVGFFWETLAPALVQEIVKVTLEGGINWFDTAEAYGNGRSEAALALALAANGRKNREVIVATKWTPLPRTARSLLTTIDTRLRCLGGYGIDLHQVHQPYSFSSIPAIMDAMAQLVRERKIRTVGVSNYSAAQMRTAHAALARHGIPLVSNQVKYSLLDRRAESRGIITAAKELGITIIAYSPLEQGLLTGKFHDDPALIRQRQGPRRWLPSFRAAGLARTRPVVDEVRRVATAHGVSAAQVALAWLTRFHADTVVAIPGATRAHHARENVGALALVLTPAELARLDEISQPFLQR